MKMEGMEVIMVEDSIEEMRERADEPREDAVLEEGIKSIPRGLRLGGANPKRSLFPLVAVARRHQERSGKVLLRDRGRAQGRLVTGGRVRGLRLVGRHWLQARRGVRADLESLGARKRKGIWSKEKEGNESPAARASLLSAKDSCRGSTGKQRRP